MNGLRCVALAALLTVSGCASFDPYNVLGRRQTSSSNTADGVPPVERSVAEVRRETLDYVWTTIAERYYRADLNGVDWKAVRTKWEPQIIAAATDDEYWQRLDRMTAELRDAHTRVENPSQVEARRAQRSKSLGLGLREIEGALVITSVHSDSDAFFAGARVGMLIEEIDDKAALPLWREWVAAARSSSSPQATRQGAARSLTDLARSKEAVTFKFRRANDETFSAPLRLREVSTRTSVSSRRLPSGVGYVRFGAFNESLRAEVLAAVRNLKDTPALILDLRGNRGGSLAFTDALISELFTAPTVISKVITRTNTPVTFAFGAVRLIPLERKIPGKADAYKGRLVVLVDDASASASEAVAGSLQAVGRARIVGDTTCGCLLGFLGHAQLAGGGELAYSEVGFQFPNGETVENKGVVPDVAVPISLADIRAQRDRGLEVAVTEALAVK